MTNYSDGTVSSNFVDLQVNGYAGVDFNSDDLSAESLHGACKRLASDNVAGILATVITNDIDRMATRLRRLAELREADPLVQQIIWGVHIEGPFISSHPAYAGAHPVSATCSACLDKTQRLLDAADGLARIVTLAPERDPQMKVTKFLADQGVCVSAGHCDSSLDQLNAAIDAGLSMFTHLGNGCPSQLSRHDNIIQRALSCANDLWISVIADGVHIPWPAFGNYLKAANINRVVVVTDAISAAGMASGRFPLGDQEVIVDEQGATWSADRSHLFGSSATMLQMAAKLKQSLGLSDKQVAQLTYLNPRCVLGM